MIYCEYGCGKEGKYLIKIGKWCCSKSPNSCIAIRKKCSSGLKKAHKDGKMRTDQLDGVRGQWAKNKTYMDDPKIKSKILENFNDHFCKNTKFRSASAIKKFLRRTNLIEYKCFTCNSEPEWQNKELVLHLDHIDGDNRNNELSNLQFLCPNCHSQTITYTGRNVSKKIKRTVSEEQILESIKKSSKISDVLNELKIPVTGGYYQRIKNIMIKYNLKFDIIKILPEKYLTRRTINRLIPCKTELCENLTEKNSKTGLCRKCCDAHLQKVNRPDAQTLLKEVIKSPMLQVGKKYGVSDSAIRKWLKSYGLPHRSSDLKKLVKLIL